MHVLKVTPHIEWHVLAIADGSSSKSISSECALKLALGSTASGIRSSTVGIDAVVLSLAACVETGSGGGDVTK